MYVLAFIRTIDEAIHAHLSDSGTPTKANQCGLGKYSSMPNLFVIL